MARHLRSALCHVKAYVWKQLPVDVGELAASVGHQWRERELTPSATMRLFPLQILHGNVAITALRHVARMTVAASSYGEARARLPLALFSELFERWRCGWPRQRG